MVERTHTVVVLTSHLLCIVSDAKATAAAKGLVMIEKGTNRLDVLTSQISDSPLDPGVALNCTNDMAIAILCNVKFSATLFLTSKQLLACF